MKTSLKPNNSILKLFFGGIFFLYSFGFAQLTIRNSLRTEITGTWKDTAVQFADIAKPYKTLPLYDSSVFTKGLHFINNQTSINTKSFTSGTDMVMGVHGDKSELRFGGYMRCGTSGFVNIAVTKNGKFIFTKDADLNLLSAWYTRQIWIRGDGTGIVEFDSGFISDRTEKGTIQHAVGSYRISNAKLIINSQSGLPQHHYGSGGFNGHLAFEDQPGGTLIIRKEPQVYKAATWFWVDATIQTDSDFTITGCDTILKTSGAPDYHLPGAFQTRAKNVSITKTGSAKLVLAKDQSYYPGASFIVNNGELWFFGDAAGAPLATPYVNELNKSDTIRTGQQELNLRIKDSGKVVIGAPKVRLKSIYMEENSILQLQKNTIIDILDTAWLNGNLVISDSNLIQTEIGHEIQVGAWRNVKGRFIRINIPGGIESWDTSGFYAHGKIRKTKLTAIKTVIRQTNFYIQEHPQLITIGIKNNIFCGIALNGKIIKQKDKNSFEKKANFIHLQKSSVHD